MRMHGHAAHDTAWYVPKKLLEEWKKKDPVDRFEKLLESEEILSGAKKKSLLGKIQQELDAAVAAALAAPYPPAEDAGTGVYA
jgi:TPP-dependent pyruvate/acetoin dehydrogenase alpha subunit